MSDAFSRQRSLPEKDDKYFKDFTQNQEEEFDAALWDLKFQNLWSLIIASDSDFEANMTLSEKLFFLVGQYNTEVVDIVTQIVNDFSRPEADRQYRPQTHLSPRHAVLLDSGAHEEGVYLNPDEMVYLVKGIFIKICAYGQPVNPGAGG